MHNNEGKKYCRVYVSPFYYIFISRVRRARAKINVIQALNKNKQTNKSKILIRCVYIYIYTFNLSDCDPVELTNHFNFLLPFITINFRFCFIYFFKNLFIKPVK